MSPVKKGISIEDLNNEIKNNPNGVELKINSAIDEMHAKKIYDGNQSMKYHGYDHVENVTKYTMYIADKKNLSIDEQEMLKDCAIYHDAGLVQSISEKYSSNNHGVSGSAYAVDSLKNKYNQQQLNEIGAIIEAHEASDRMLGAICSKYGIYDIDEIKKVNEMSSILKDADALDRARFPGNLDINHLRNDESKDLVKAAFENVEIKSSNKLKELLNSKTLSKNEYSEVSMLMKSGKYPDHIVLFALENYKNPTIQNSTNIHSITEYANYILNNKKFS